MNSKWTKNVSAFILGWLVGISIWRLIRGISYDTDIEMLNLVVSPAELFLIQLGIVIIAGLVFGTVQYLYERFFQFSISFRAYLLQSLIIHLVLMTCIYFVAYMVLTFTNLMYDLTFVEFFSNPLVLSNLSYSFLLNGSIVLLFYCLIIL